MLSLPFLAEEFGVKHPFPSQGVNGFSKRILRGYWSCEGHLGHAEWQRGVGEGVIHLGYRLLGHGGWLHFAPLSPFALPLPFLVSGG